MSKGYPNRVMIKGKEIVVGGIYHILHRAPGLEKIFVEESDYLKMLYFLKEISKDYLLQIFAFVLMPNHLHILLRLNEENLTEAMHKLFTRYGIYYNKKYERKGPVFSAPYRAILCTDERYFITATLYIHLNPVISKLCSLPEEYKWSSANLYVKETRRNSFIDYKYPLSLIHNNLSEAKKIYRDLLEEGIKLKMRDIFGGNKQWLNIRKRLGRVLKIPIKNKEEDFEGKLEEYRKKKFSKKPEDKDGKKYLILQLKAQGYSYQEIGDLLGISRISIYKLIKGKVNISS